MTAVQKNLNSSVILQTYNWNSWRHHNKSFYNYIASKSHDIKKAGIDTIWLPPCSKSVSPQGYLPLNLYDLNSEYGNEESLISCIKAYKDKNITVLGDIVINHRCAEFQNHEGIYNVFGGKLPWDDTAIVSNDVAFKGKGNYSEFPLFHGAPNIDHSQKFVRDDLTQWMLWLKNNIGFDGFRFDFMTGIDPEHMKDYFSRIDTNICVGEYWDSMEYENHVLKYNQNAHRQRMIDWIDNTNKVPYVFDQTTKGVLQEALEKNEFWRLADENNQPPGVMGWWKEKCITFLDNHDTHHKSQNLWPFPCEFVVEGYAYILTHPGTPMICWDDLKTSGLNNILLFFIQLRKDYKITSCSTVNIITADDTIYSAVIDEKIKVTIGKYIEENADRTIFKTHSVLIEDTVDMTNEDANSYEHPNLEHVEYF